MVFQVSQRCVCLFPPSQRFLRNQACRFLPRASTKARMALRLREHLANKGRPNEAEQMVRENSPVVPCEQPVQWERGERGQSQGGFVFMSRLAGFGNGCLEAFLEGEQQGDDPSRSMESRLKRSWGVSIQHFSCWGIAGWKAEAETGLCCGCCEAVLGFGR